jgi:hypothetical protein
MIKSFFISYQFLTTLDSFHYWQMMRLPGQAQLFSTSKDNTLTLLEAEVSTNVVCLIFFFYLFIFPRL